MFPASWACCASIKVRCESHSTTEARGKRAREASERSERANDSPRRKSCSETSSTSRISPRCLFSGRVSLGGAVLDLESLALGTHAGNRCMYFTDLLRHLRSSRAHAAPSQCLLRGVRPPFGRLSDPPLRCRSFPQGAGRLLASRAVFCGRAQTFAHQASGASKSPPRVPGKNGQSAVHRRRVHIRGSARAQTCYGQNAGQSAWEPARRTHAKSTSAARNRRTDCRG